MGQKFNTAILAVVLLLGAVNLIFLDLAVFGKPQLSPSITPESGGCSQCERLTADVAKLNVLLSPTASPLIQTSPTPTVAQSATTFTQTVAAREYYIALGTGKGKSNQWEALPGVEAYIDTRNYPTIKQATFEVYMHLQAGVGQMRAKLYNATDGHDVWFSELATESDTTLRKEAKITLDHGNKLYRVMVLSTIKADAFVDNARIKLITY